MPFSPRTSTSSLTDAHSALARDEAVGITLEKDTRRAQKENAARLQATQTVHALSTLGPVLGQAMKASDNEVEQAQWLFGALRQAHGFAHQVFSDLGLEEGQEWARAVLERVYLEALSTTGEAPSPRLVRAALEAHRRSALPELVARTESPSRAHVAPERASLELPDRAENGAENGLGEISGVHGAAIAGLETQVRLAWYGAMGAISRAQVRFDFFRPDADADLVECADRVWRFAVEALPVLLDGHARDADRAATLETLLVQGGLAMEQSWDAEGQKANHALQQKSRADVTAWKQANRQGFPLTTVFSRFEQQARRLVLLGRQAPPAQPKGRKAN
jgi:hypothetical protein